MNYYNEHDPKAAAWLRELIKQGHIPDGFVDTRSIVDVRRSDLVGYTQCHFFAGIGGWSRALQLAGWPADRPVWTGSCPCQPFSCAGKGKGTADERHLWPEFDRLIGECGPPVVFGEQVASKAGREWLSGVFADLEGMGYAAAGADLCAAGSGAPHIRQRLFWVAYGVNGGSQDGRPKNNGANRHCNTLRTSDSANVPAATELCATCGSRHAESIGRAGRADAADSGRRECAPGRAGAGGARRLLHASEQGPQGFAGDGDDGHEPGRLDAEQDGSTATASGAGNGFWDSWEPLYFRDGKTRRTKPGLFCLAHGVSARVVRLRGYGNAIVPQVAAEFVMAAEAARLLTDAEVEALTWDWPPAWPEYAEIEQAMNEPCNKKFLTRRFWMNTSWHSYPSIYALGHNALGELLMDPVLIEEKVDGSQFSFGVFEENGERVFRCRSKGCIMVPDAPEKMFQAAVDTARALPLRPGWTYRAEYLAKPKHNVLAYARTPKDHLIIFDINDAEESYLGYDEKAAEAARIGLEVVPRLLEGNLSTLDAVLPLLDTTSILEGQKIEGFVIKNYSRFGRDKKVLMGKFVCAEFKESHSKEWKSMNPTKTDIVDALIAGLKTDARFQKAVQHLRESGAICGEPRDIGALIKEVQADIEKECEAEIKDALFKYALPKIRRGVVAGLPEWYKSQLAQSQFS